MVPIRGLLLLLPVGLALACSHVSVREITAERPYHGGLRFYRPWPYLLVTPEKNEGVKVQVVVLPDLSQEYAIEPHVRLGNVEMKASLADGWNLTELGASADPQIAKTIESIASLASVGGALAAAPSDGAPGFPLAPGLYRLVYAGGHVSGVERIPLVGAP
ncbi:hypothetical protein MYXO_03547 [Myxococcaceae bacterium]|jgi:hypothetical protein|nr:hypothetical protein MYXO_03547 [Myxococcaceae bacterium]